MKRNIFSRAALLLTVLILLSQFCLPALAESEGDVVYIASADDLTELAANCAYDAWSVGKTVVLQRDIALGGVEFAPIASFGGEFDGNGHAISGLSVTGSISSAGLFGVVTASGIVHDLIVEGDVSPNGSGERVGGIAGINRGTLADCSFVGTVSGEKRVGGVSGVNEATGTLRRCEMTGGVFGKNMTGGVVGENRGAVSYCVNRAYVNTNTIDPGLSIDKFDISLANGLKGLASPEAYNITVDSGGVAGFSDGALFGCRNFGSVGYQHIGYNVGGIVGRSSGHVASCSNAGAVYGRREVGGVAGTAEPYVRLDISESSLARVREELSALTDQIDRTVTDAESGGDAVNARLSALGDGVSEATDNTKALVDSLTDYWDGTVAEIDRGSEIVDVSITQLRDVAEDLRASTATLTDAADHLKRGLDAIEFPAFSEGLFDDLGALADELEITALILDEGLSEVRTGLDELGRTLSPADPNMSRQTWRKQVSGDLTKLWDGLGTAAKGMSAITGAFAPVSDAASKAADRSLTIEDLRRAFEAIHSAVGSEEMKNGVNDLQSGLDSVQSAMSHLRSITKVDPERYGAGMEHLERGMDILAHGRKGEDGGKGAAYHFARAMSHLADFSEDADRLSRELKDAGKGASDAVDEFDMAAKLTRDALTQLTDALVAAERLVNYLNAQDRLQFESLGPETDAAADTLYDTVRGISDNLELLNDEVRSVSDKVLEDVRQINRRFTALMNTLLDIVEDVEGASASTAVEDTSDQDLDAVVSGKMLLCSNAGEVAGDIDVGGVAGAMMVFSELDPENDEKTLSDFFHRRYELKCVLQNCVNTGSVTGKKDNVGSVCGSATLGIIIGCEGYGTARSEGGSCVGGIAGYANNIVRKCWAKSSLSGTKYVGGIVGSGKTEGTDLRVENCRSLVEITEYDQYAGAILGADTGVLSGNCFVSGELAGIDRVSEQGRAEPISYAQLLTETGLPSAFRQFTLRFVADGATVSSRLFDYGDSFGEEVFPAIPAVAGEYGRWDRTDLTDLCFDTTVTAVYEPCLTALDSRITRSASRPVFFAEGAFDDAAVLDVSPAMLDFDDGDDSLLHRLRSYRRTLLEQWQLTVPDDGAQSHVIRYLPPEDAGRKLELYIRDGGRWTRLVPGEMGSYLTFETAQRDIELTVISAATPWWVWTLVICFLAAAALLALHMLIRRRQPKTAQPQAQKTEQTPETPETEQALAERAKMEKHRKNHRMIRAALLGTVLALGVAVGATVLTAPRLNESMGLYMLLRNYAARTDLDMDLSISAKVDGKSFDTNVTYFTTACEDRRVSCILWEDVPLYYCDGVLLLENGRSYRAEGVLPDYATLLQHAAKLYRVVDVTASEENGVKTYHATAQGETARQIFRAIMPAASELSCGEGTLTMDMVLTDGEATSLTVHWNDSNGDALAVLRRAAVAHDHSLPQEVRAAITAGDHTKAEEIGDAARRLLLAWTELVTRDPLSAKAALKASCGPLLVDETMDWQRTDRNGTKLFCLSSQGTRLYYTDEAACTEGGLSVSRARDSFDRTPRLLHLAYQALLLGDTTCSETADGWRYTVALDADAMAAFVEAIAPETSAMGFSPEKGTMRLDLTGGSAASVSMQCTGSVRVVRADVPARASMRLDFSGEATSEPPAQVLAALKLDESH